MGVPGEMLPRRRPLPGEQPLSHRYGGVASNSFCLFRKPLYSFQPDFRSPAGKELTTGAAPTLWDPDKTDGLLHRVASHSVVDGRRAANCRPLASPVHFFRKRPSNGAIRSLGGSHLSAPSGTPS